MIPAIRRRETKTDCRRVCCSATVLPNGPYGCHLSCERDKSLKDAQMSCTLKMLLSIDRVLRNPGVRSMSSAILPGH